MMREITQLKKAGRMVSNTKLLLAQRLELC